MRLRGLILSTLLGVGLLFASSTTASAGLFNHCKTSSCYTPCYTSCYYYTPCYYTTCYPGYTYTIYKVWHVYTTDPATGAPKIVSRYLKKEDADGNADVVAKKAYVQEVSYYAP